MVLLFRSIAAELRGEVVERPVAESGAHFADMREVSPSGMPSSSAPIVSARRPFPDRHPTITTSCSVMLDLDPGLRRVCRAGRSDPPLGQDALQWPASWSGPARPRSPANAGGTGSSPRRVQRARARSAGCHRACAATTLPSSWRMSNSSSRGTLRRGRAMSCGLVNPIRRLQQPEVGPAIRVQRHDLTVEHDHVVRQRGRDPRELRIRRGDVVAVPGDQPEMSVADLDDRPGCRPTSSRTPTRPRRSRSASRAWRAWGRPAHRCGRPGVRMGDLSAARALRRSGGAFRQPSSAAVLHPVDQPVLLVAVARRADERELARGSPPRPPSGWPCSVTMTSSSRHFSSSYVAGIPDVDVAAAVLALRDVAGEGRVLERVVLGVHGEVVLLRVGRHAPSAPPRRPARRRAPAGSPSAAAGRGAPG